MKPHELVTTSPASARRPLVSVIIPVFNCDRYLGAAIRSVLAQTYHSLEIVAIDDGSTDRSADVARAFHAVRYTHQAHAGLSAALNHGVRLARGRFLAFLDADDLWTAQKLSLQMARFDRDPGLDIVFGHVQQFAGEGVPPADARSEPGYSKGTMLVTQGAFSRVGAFDPKWRMGDFVDWYSRALDIGLKSLMLSDVFLWRRVHASNMSVRETARRTDYARIVKLAIDRRRNRQPEAP
jgi:glycosyltransferase involved in cell wall biosynthesis